MEFICDIQGFRNGDNDYIVKELAIISIRGQIYELQLFQPPCKFSDLPTDLKKQVCWLERQHHGLYWGSGFREYEDLKDIFKNLNISGNIYVKGVEKHQFIAKLLQDYNVNVINLENLGCPSLSELKKDLQLSTMKPCSFNHNFLNCAYINVHVLQQWLKLEKIIESKLEFVNRAINQCYTKGYTNMQTDLVKYLPKEFILNHYEDVENIYDKLDYKLKCDFDIFNNMRCTDHFHSEITPKRKHCFFCSYRKKPCNDDSALLNDNGISGQIKRSNSV